MKKFVYIVVPVVAFILIISQIILSNELAGARGVIRTFDSNIATLTEEHDILSQQVASASALTTISQKALLVGFIAPTKTNVVSIDGSYSVAVASSQHSVQ